MPAMKPVEIWPQALTSEREKTFNAGASYYGVSDLTALARDTHKFESHYLDWLIGPYPQEHETYVGRSPINHVDRLTVPVIFFQGAEDKVVPPNQTELMVAALKSRGIPVGYFLFDGDSMASARGRTFGAPSMRNCISTPLLSCARGYTSSLACEPSAPLRHRRVFA